MTDIKKELSLFMVLCKKEILHYFMTPSAYIVMAVFLIIAGYLFTVPVFLRANADIQSFLETAPLLLVFFSSAVGMRVFAEEMKNSTIEILASLPVRDFYVVTAKALAAMSVIVCTLALTLVYPISVSFIGDIDFSVVAVSYLGLLFNSLLFISISVSASSLTKNQIIGFIISFGLCFFLYMVGKLQGYMPPSIAQATSFIGIDSHLSNFFNGIIDFRDIVYYLSLSFFFLFTAHVRLVVMRFR